MSKPGKSWAAVTLAVAQGGPAILQASVGTSAGLPALRPGLEGGGPLGSLRPRQSRLPLHCTHLTLVTTCSVSFKGRRKGRSQSIQAHGALSQRPPTLSSSGPILESHQAFLQTSTSAHGLAPRLSGSRLSLRTSAASLHSQPPPVTTTGHLSVRERAEALIRSSLGSSTSSTLSFLFGKRSFSSALVISGLSAAEGSNTSDTQSSSSVNIVMGPSARAAGQAARVRARAGQARGVLACRPHHPLHSDRRQGVSQEPVWLCLGAGWLL